MNNDIIDVLAGDPFYYNIINNLKSDDLYNLSQTCQYYKINLNLSLIKRQTIKEINNKFQELFSNQTTDFKKIIKELECVVTGSFILQSILGLFWQETDMDIYIDVKKEDEKSKTILDYFLTDKMGYKIIKHTSSYVKSLIGINEVRTYDKKNSPYKIQLIVVSTEMNLHDYVNSNFDFDICKNIYSIDHNNRELLSVYKINEILSRKTKFALNDRNRIGSSVERCKKYQKRGFNFTNRKTLTFKDFNNANIFEVSKINGDDNSYQIINGNMDKLKETISNKICFYKRNQSYEDNIKILDDKMILNKQILKPCHNYFGLCIITDLCCENHLHSHLDDQNDSLIVINNEFSDQKSFFSLDDEKNCDRIDVLAELDDYDEVDEIEEVSQNDL